MHASLRRRETSSSVRGHEKKPMRLPDGGGEVAADAVAQPVRHPRAHELQRVGEQHRGKASEAAGDGADRRAAAARSSAALTPALYMSEHMRSTPLLGTTRITFAMLPRHRPGQPSTLTASATSCKSCPACPACDMSLARSSGAVAVLATAPLTPPASTSSCLLSSVVQPASTAALAASLAPRDRRPAAAAAVCRAGLRSTRRSRPPRRAGSRRRSAGVALACRVVDVLFRAVKHRARDLKVARSCPPPLAHQNTPRVPCVYSPRCLPRLETDRLPRLQVVRQGCGLPFR